MSKVDEKQLFKQFLESNQVLIIDKNSASRRRLVKTILDLGGKRHQIDSVSQFEEAKEIIISKTPKLVLSDYDLIGGSGFDLFKEYRSINPSVKDATLILITANISQSAVAKAAEEDVDSFIIKPYTVQSLEVSLVKAVMEKLYPSKYIQTVEKGKEALFASRFEEAEQIFQEAIGLSSKPSLALFYHGQAQLFLDLDQNALDDYKKGLSYNSIHFKCQVGLYEYYFKQHKFQEAYSVAQNIAKYFPSNPQRLKEIIRLAVVTQNYLDMPIFYNHFKELEMRSDDVINYVCAGMYVFGKYLLQAGNKEKAMEIYEKVGITCAGTTRFLRAMITEFHRNNLHSEAIKLMARFPISAQESEDYFVSNFLANSASMTPSERVFQGNELYNKGFKDLESMILLARALDEEGKKEKAMDIAYETKNLWPSNSRLTSLPKEEESEAA